MMAAFRAFAKSPLAIGLMGLLILSFGVWGVRDVFHTRISNSVITAGSRTVSADEFKRMFDGRLAAAQQRTGQVISAEQAVREGADQQMLEELADIEALQALIRRDGVQPSDQLFVAELHKHPEFFNPITGAFDKQAYQSVLAQNQLTVEQFESGLRDQIAADHFLSGLAAGLRAPRIYSALYAVLGLESRDADYFVIDQKTVGTPPTPTDAELTKYMKDHAFGLRPELRSLSLVRFSAQNLAPTLPADPAAVQKQFDFEKAQLSVPERRSFVQIPAKDAGQAAAMAARLAKGDDPSAVAAAFGVKPISYPNAAKTAVADPKVADAAFAMQPGQTSAPIQGELGYSIVKLASITPGKPATLEDVRPQIEQKVRDQEAKDKVYDQVQKYDDLHSGGAPMAQAAKAAGVQIFAIGPIGADGRVYPSGQPQTGLNQKMLTDAFNLPQGGETEVTDLGAGEYYAIRVEKITPPSLPSLDEIRPQLTQRYMMEEFVNSLKAKAAALEDQLKKGQSLAAAAASAGATVQHLQSLTRVAASQQKTLGGDFLNGLFLAKPGDDFIGSVDPAGFAIGKLTAIHPGPLPEVARETVAQRPQLTQQMSENEFGDMLRTAARNAIKPKVDEALVRQTLGVTPDQVPVSSGGAAQRPAP